MKPTIDSIRHPLAIDPGAGRLAQEPEHAAHVEQMIKQVLLTSPGERINRPDFGCGLRRMIFASSSDTTAQLFRVIVIQALEKWLDPLIAVDSVQIAARGDALDVHITYLLKARGERRYLNLEVTP